VNDEKTTEIELPQTVANNIVRVNFTERRKIARAPSQAQAQAAYTLRPTRTPLRRSQNEWTTPWWVRLAALLAILALSLFVL
jgi:hypothetical protein